MRKEERRRRREDGRERLEEECCLDTCLPDHTSRHEKLKDKKCFFVRKKGNIDPYKMFAI